MLRKSGTSIALALTLLLAPAARAEVVADGPASGRFAEFVGATGTTFVSGSIQVEQGVSEVSVDLYVHDSSTGFFASGWGMVPRRFAGITGDGATVSFDLADVPEFALQACGVVDGLYRCDVAASGRVEVALRRSGAKVHESWTSEVESADGAVRLVKVSEWTAPATAEGSVLGTGLPPETSAKYGGYHQRVVAGDEPR